MYNIDIWTLWNDVFKTSKHAAGGLNPSQLRAEETLTLYPFLKHITVEEVSPLP